MLCPLNVREMRIAATCLEEMPGAFVPEYPFIPISYGFKLAREPWEPQAFWKLRERIFCGEQKLFTGSDRDEHDANMLPIIAVACEMGTPDRVVGVVRIDEREPGLWWGSRLAVDPDFRRVRSVGCGPFPNDQPHLTASGRLAPVSSIRPLAPRIASVAKPFWRLSRSRTPGSSADCIGARWTGSICMAGHIA
jgi:hypothetical protein